MDSQHHSSTPEHLFVNQTVTRSASKSFLANVFAYMFLALSVSAITAFLLNANPEWLIPFATNKLLFYLVVFGPIGLSLLIYTRFSKFSVPVLMFLFILYSFLVGITLSFVLIIYTQQSVFSCFAAAAVMFGVMAIMGYKTDKDLTSFGRLMYMGFIGVFVSCIINFFLQSDTMSYIIGIVGVMVFTGLTAYDVQKLKNIGEGIDANGDTLEADAKKLSIIGGLTLYLDFINLFLMLLRVFGRRN
ncbi:MAG TPA: Bax inhibitor-1/YccA family protein [Chitinophagaceae bacterium]